MNSSKERRKREREERRAIEAWPPGPEFQHAIAKAAQLRSSWATRSRRPRRCDICGSEDHRPLLEARGL